jgi:hypothetical protein
MEVAARLTATLHAPGGRIVLSQAELTQIAEALGTQLPITTQIDLMRACNAVGQLHLESTRLAFTPPQLRLIQERAAKSGDTLPQFVARIASKLLTDVFLVQPAREGVFAAPTVEVDPEEYVDGPDAEDLDTTPDRFDRHRHG